MSSKQRNKKVQVKLLASTAAWKRDPKTVTLHKNLKQAQQAAEELREQTVPREKYEELREQTIPREKYEELQQQLRNVNLSESQAFEGCEEKKKKIRR